MVFGVHGPPLGLCTSLPGQEFTVWTGVHSASWENYPSLSLCKGIALSFGYFSSYFRLLLEFYEKFCVTILISDIWYTYFCPKFSWGLCAYAPIILGLNHINSKVAYCVQFCSPHLRKNIANMEQVQRRATPGINRVAQLCPCSIPSPNPSFDVVTIHI